MICFQQKKSNTNGERIRSLLILVPEISKKNLKILSPVLNMGESHYEHWGIPFQTSERPKWAWRHHTSIFHNFSLFNKSKLFCFIYFSPHLVNICFDFLMSALNIFRLIFHFIFIIVLSLINILLFILILRQIL